jgi:hypothetical protein
MNNKITELQSKAEELKKQHDELFNSIIHDDSIPQDIKNGLIEIRERFDNESAEYKKKLEENKGRKIIGYDTETFEPIYERQFFAVYEREPAHGATPNGVILSPYNTKEEAEEAKVRYGYNTDNYYVDKLIYTKEQINNVKNIKHEK